jgi:hypothetical protein
MSALRPAIRRCRGARIAHARRALFSGIRVAPALTIGGNPMDLVYLGLTAGFFAVSLALVELFDRL